jgi:hypothetical protein
MSFLKKEDADFLLLDTGGSADPSGSMLYWFNGQPYAGIRHTVVNDQMLFWANGLPNGYIFAPLGGGGANKIILDESTPPATSLKDIIMSGIIPFAR